MAKELEQLKNFLKKNKVGEIIPPYFTILYTVIKAVLLFIGRIDTGSIKQNRETRNSSTQVYPTDFLKGVKTRRLFKQRCWDN